MQNILEFSENTIVSLKEFFGFKNYKVLDIINNKFVVFKTILLPKRNLF
jgi:hypothetical protein